jgi:hypothetical protein
MHPVAQGLPIHACLTRGIKPRRPRLDHRHRQQPSGLRCIVALSRQSPKLSRAMLRAGDNNRCTHSILHLGEAPLRRQRIVLSAFWKPGEESNSTAVGITPGALDFLATRGHLRESSASSGNGRETGSRALSRNRGAVLRLSMHHHRQGCVLQDVPRHAAKNLLPQTRVRIGAHGQQVAVELFGRR